MCTLRSRPAFATNQQRSGNEAMSTPRDRAEERCHRLEASTCLARVKILKDVVERAGGDDDAFPLPHLKDICTDIAHSWATDYFATHEQYVESDRQELRIFLSIYRLVTLYVVDGIRTKSKQTDIGE